MMRRTYRHIFHIGLSLASTTAIAAEKYKPVLPLKTTWKSPSSSSALADESELLQSKETTKKAMVDFKESLSKLQRKLTPSEQAKALAQLRQSSIKISPKAKLLAELTAARVTAGLSASGAKAGKPSGNWRTHLLAACNISAKIDETLHEETALQSIALWRRVEGPDAPWTTPPIDIKAQKKFTFYKAITERQALREWDNGQQAQALKKYRTLSTGLVGTADGAAVDLRIVELERSIYKQENQQTRNVKRWQKTLMDTSAKYQDKQFLGAGNEAKVERVTSVVASIHKNLISDLIRDAMPAKASDASRKQALKAIDLYITGEIDNAEKERVRSASGEIQFNGGDHKSAAGTFAALATEHNGSKASLYWRKAIRSQTILATWPGDAPWDGIPKGDLEPREVLIDMYRKIDSSQAGDWPVAAQIGLLMIANAKTDEAFSLWSDRIAKFPKGQHASQAAGWMVSARMNSKQWADLETLGRVLVSAQLTANHAKKTYKPKDVLGIALLEGGLEALTASDFKKSVAKLEEYVKGWRNDTRHDEGMYHLALAYQGDKQYRAAILQLEAYTKTYPKSKWRHDALVNGGAWTLALTWDEHVMYFLETHTKEFPGDELAQTSLQTLTDLYLGREIYDSATRVMTILLTRKDLDPGSKIDVARRLLDTAEKHGSPENALRIAEKINSMFKNEQSIAATALSLKARVLAQRGQVGALTGIDNTVAEFDQSQPAIAEVISEIKFLLAETIAKDQFKDEIFSLGTKDPKAELEKGYSQYIKIDRTYKSACLGTRVSWCGPALHKSARLGEAFLRAYNDLSIPETLGPDVANDFKARKKAIMEGIESMTLDADEKSLEQARSGATNPDWTSAIMWQNGVEWNKEKYTGENANHFIQWHTR